MPLKHSAPSVFLLGAEETPALAILWSLARCGVPVTVGSHRRLCAGFFSRYPVRRVLLPDPLRSPDEFIERVLTEVRQRSHVVTLGCGEQTTYLLAKHRQSLDPYTRVPLVDLETFMECRDKSRTMKAAARCGVPIPRTWFPEETGIDEVAGDATYPAVLKPCVSDGARGISFVHTPETLRQAHAVTRARYGPCIVQELIPHGGTQYKAELLLDRRQNVRLWGTYAKLRYYPPTGGSSTLNRTVRRRDLLEQASTLLTHLGWWGMADCDFIVDPRDGVARLMEINPRFTRTIRVLVEAGLDFPYALYRLALGEDPGMTCEQEEDVYLRYLPADVVWFLRSSDRLRARPSFFKFLGRRLHYEEWSARDPLTGVGFWLSLLLDLLDPELRRERLR
ncbi:MAG TPA: ATP-grasp domain-containing protein [Candidatus Polarisedimenticolia bacterium]|nr:ATP-grasp domain-containing protein [Candidatus Polarisedimenticolia bacterium]